MNPAALYEAHAEVIERVTRTIARRYGLSQTDHDDFLQEVRFRLLRNDARVLRGFRGRARFETYIWKIVKGWCATWSRRQLVWERFAARWLDSGEDRHPFAGMQTVSLETRETAMRLGLALDDIIGKLSATDREILSRRFMQGMEAREIAEMLHITRAAAFKRVERLLRRLHVSLACAGFTSTDVARILASGMFEWSATNLTPRAQNPEPRIQGAKPAPGASAEDRWAGRRRE
jgi:RNA polymerase sigma factor (sigma-70 family)